MHKVAHAVQSAVGTAPTVAEPGYKGRGDGSTMKALAWFAPGDVRIVDAPVPDITEPGDIIIKVTGTTVCGSDLHLYRGEIVPMEKGDILGHEFMGVVDEVGPDVKKFQVGQRVVASFMIACGECYYCKQKLSSFCNNTNPSKLMNYLYGHRLAGIFGYSHLTGGFPGGQAEFVRVPKGDINLLPIPDDVPDEKVLYLSDVVGTSYHNVFDTGIKEGDVVAVWGLGPIGQCAVRWAKLFGASRVIAIDRVPERLAFAKEKSGAEVVDFSKHEDLPGWLQEIAPGGIDVGLHCATFREPKTVIHKIERALMLETDAPEIVNEMILAVKKGGRIGIISDFIGFANHVNLGGIMEKGIRFIGNGQAPIQKYWESLLHDYIIPGKFDPTFMITHRIPLEDVPKLYQKFDKREGGIIKTFVETKWSNPPAPGTPSLTRL